MIGPTLAITALFALMVMIVRPGFALGLIIASMLVWPEFLRVPVVLAQMSVPRMVALVLLFRLIKMGRHKKIGSSAADKLVVFVWLFTIFASVVTGRPSYQQTQFIGAGLDTVLMYFAARLALTTLDDVRGFAVPVAITAVFMGIMGGYEAVTAHSPYRRFDQYATIDIWDFDKGDEFRYGFLRARASTSVHIYFGLAMMILTSLIWAARKSAGPWIWLGLIAGTVGVLSSMSSGPWTGLFFLIFINLYYYNPKLIKPSLMLTVAMAFALDVLSNRHFYNLIDYIALSGETAWYRTRLMEVSVNHISEYWLVGIGTRPLDDWAAELDGRGHIDIVNHFIIVAINGGLPALSAYVGAHVVAVRAAMRAWRESGNVEMRSLLFGLCTSLIAVDFATMSVGLFGPPLLLSNLLLGFLVSISLVEEVVSQPIERVRLRTGRTVVSGKAAAANGHQGLGLPLVADDSDA